MRQNSSTSDQASDRRVSKACIEDGTSSDGSAIHATAGPRRTRRIGAAELAPLLACSGDFWCLVRHLLLVLDAVHGTQSRQLLWVRAWRSCAERAD